MSSTPGLFSSKSCHRDLPPDDRCSVATEIPWADREQGHSMIGVDLRPKLPVEGCWNAPRPDCQEIVLKLPESGSNQYPGTDSR